MEWLKMAVEVENNTFCYKCRFCGKMLRTDESKSRYYCDCEGQKKYLSLLAEKKHLEDKLYDVERSLETIEQKSYEKQLEKLRKEQLETALFLRPEGVGFCDG